MIAQYSSKKASKATKKQAEIFTISNDYKECISSQSYLGKKGYTIPKSILSKDDLNDLYKELYMKPQIIGACFGAPKDDVAFPVYRENANKIYIPRFYGIERYGLPLRSEIENGDDINVDFVKPLRGYQDEIINIYMNYVKNTPIDRISDKKCSGGILEVPCGAGKTVMALKIISLLKKKTLIIVHKEFLMNQWIERIQEFLPDATVGKIQGTVFDVKGNDIVIGMIQTMYNKEYPADAFSCFGLTIIDEVHRIGSEQFSKTLLKTITPYMLGISATVDRKDGLTKVIHMFIGNKIYSKPREDEDAVCVRAIQYKVDDSEFNETDLDFRGNPKYSGMIVKLCSYNRRSEFIVRVINDLVVEDPEKQIMILCHNRSLLTYLYQGINHKGFATVGYYVGGMKQANLQETETKQIVLATYAMAAEALDIKTLSTLVMVTPKTDITQSVGRILRVKHANPIVVDIVDAHDIFQNQWAQRKRFYKKCNYLIRQIDSKSYTNMSIDWLNDYTWKRVYEPKEKKVVGCDVGTSQLKSTDLIGKCIIDF